MVTESGNVINDPYNLGTSYKVYDNITGIRKEDWDKIDAWAKFEQKLAK
jgi:hypothetical protein